MESAHCGALMESSSAIFNANAAASIHNFAHGAAGNFDFGAQSINAMNDLGDLIPEFDNCDFIGCGIVGARVTSEADALFSNNRFTKNGIGIEI